MAGGAINLVFNTIEASYSDNSWHPWPDSADMMIVYHSAQYYIITPLIITKYMYDELCRNAGSGNGQIGTWTGPNQAYQHMIYYVGSLYPTSDLRKNFYLINRAFCIFVS